MLLKKQKNGKLKYVLTVSSKSMKVSKYDLQSRTPGREIPEIPGQNVGTISRETYAGNPGEIYIR